LGPSQVARSPKISAQISDEMVTRFMPIAYQLSSRFESAGTRGHARSRPWESGGRASITLTSEQVRL
jgi:hypothetical protein